MQPHCTHELSHTTRIEELQRKETAANAEVSRLKEELAEAGERLIAETADKDAVAGELQALRDSNAAMEMDWKSGKRPVRSLQPHWLTSCTHHQHLPPSAVLGSLSARKRICER